MQAKVFFLREVAVPAVAAILLKITLPETISFQGEGDLSPTVGAKIAQDHKDSEHFQILTVCKF